MLHSFIAALALLLPLDALEPPSHTSISVVFLPSDSFETATGWSAISAPGDTNNPPFSADFSFFTNGVTVLEVTRDYEVKAFGETVGRVSGERWTPEGSFSRVRLAPIICALVTSHEALANTPSEAREELRAALDAAGSLGF